jgi:hypothetical protein
MKWSASFCTGSTAFPTYLPRGIPDIDPPHLRWGFGDMGCASLGKRARAFLAKERRDLLGGAGFSFFAANVFFVIPARVLFGDFRQLLS